MSGSLRVASKHALETAAIWEETVKGDGEQN